MGGQAGALVTELRRCTTELLPTRQAPQRSTAVRPNCIPGSKLAPQLAFRARHQQMNPACAATENPTCIVDQDMKRLAGALVSGGKLPNGLQGGEIELWPHLHCRS